jgi:hypothetical protein
VTALQETETLSVHETEHQSWWPVGRLWVVVLAFSAVALVRSHQVGIPLRDPHGAYLIGRIELTLSIAAGLVLADGVLRSGRPFDVRRVLATIRARWSRGRILVAVLALLAYHVTYFAYHNLKSWDVLNEPRDDMLLRWDRWLFFGHSPAVLLHDLLGEHVAAWILYVWYETFPTLVVLAFPAAVILSTRMRDACVGIASLVWVWILGTACYYAIPSLGPFDSAPQEFAGLPHMPIQDTQARYMDQRAHLLADPSAHDAFAQVSAFASLHVGVAAVILGIAWWHRLRRTTIALTIFLAGTIVATVYLGWHFALDDVAGLAIAGLAWVLGPLTVGIRRRPPRRVAV